MATVSRHINASGYVSRRAGERIDAAVVELGFRPSIVARTLVTGRSKLVGFLVSDLANPFSVEVAQGIHDRAFEAGWSALIAMTDGDAVKESRSLDLLVGRHIDGLVLTPLEGGAGDEMLRALVSRGVPVVLLGSSLPGARVDKVTSDTIGGEMAAVRHLLKFGHKRIALVGADRERGVAVGRLEGYRRALEEVDVRADDALILSTSLDRDGGAEALGDLVDLGDLPTAVACVNDEIAVGVILEASRRGLAVPRDVSVVGFDDTSMAAYSAPPLTTVRQPTRLMGAAAVEFILSRLKAPELESREQRFACELIVRASTGPPRPRSEGFTFD